MQSALEEIQSDTAALKHEQTSIRELTTKLQTTVNSLRNSDLHIIDADEDGTISLVDLYNQVHDLEVWRYLDVTKYFFGTI